MLENVNLKRKLSRDEYKLILPGLQTRLYQLEKACWDNQIPSIVVVQGWDAAGKGEAIATVTQRLDPRGFKLYPIAPPRNFEQQFPWLWRFWLKVPNRGEMVIFDDSWYGRVLHERVSGAIPEKHWREAYRDILEFERMLSDDGAVILKFFLHISKKEQKKRFHEIEDDPLESWRITPADWARHHRYDEYLAAYEEMLELTESEYAPWVIVEATSRWHARKRIFETLIAALELRLGASTPPAAGAEAADADLRDEMERLGGEDNGDV